MITVIALCLILMCVAFNGMPLTLPNRNSGNFIFFVLGIVLLIVEFFPLGSHPLLR